MLDNHSDVVANLQKYLCNFCTLRCLPSMLQRGGRRWKDSWLCVCVGCFVHSSLSFSVINPTTAPPLWMRSFIAFFWVITDEDFVHKMKSWDHVFYQKFSFLWPHLRTPSIVTIRTCSTTEKYCSGAFSLNGLTLGHYPQTEKLIYGDLVHCNKFKLISHTEKARDLCDIKTLTSC